MRPSEPKLCVPNSVSRAGPAAVRCLLALALAGLAACEPAKECEIGSRTFGTLTVPTAEESHYFQKETGYISITLKDCGTLGCKADIYEVGVDGQGPFTISEEVSCR